MNLISLYKEIGIDMLINNEKADRRIYFDESKYNKYEIINNEGDIYKIQNKDEKIKELESALKNFDGCSLKKTAKNLKMLCSQIATHYNSKTQKV